MQHQGHAALRLLKRLEDPLLTRLGSSCHHIHCSQCSVLISTPLISWHAWLSTHQLLPCAAHKCQALKQVSTWLQATPEGQAVQNISMLHCEETASVRVSCDMKCRGGRSCRYQRALEHPEQSASCHKQVSAGSVRSGRGCAAQEPAATGLVSKAETGTLQHDFAETKTLWGAKQGACWLPQFS